MAGQIRGSNGNKPSQLDQTKEIARLRRELKIAQQECDIQKKVCGRLRESKMKRFKFIEQMRKAYPIEMLCRVMHVSSRGFRSWRGRPLSERARQDMILSAHIRAQAKLCSFSYGRIRMAMELKELGFYVGERRVSRLMAANDIKVERRYKYKRTTDSKHGFPFAENLLERDFTASAPNRKWVSDISYT